MKVLFVTYDLIKPQHTALNEAGKLWTSPINLYTAVSNDKDHWHSAAVNRETGERTYGEIGSNLEEVIWVEDPLIVCTQMRPDGFSRSKSHLDRYLSPAPLSADGIKASLFIHQL